MIFCCGGFREPSRVIILSPDFKYKDRKLQIVICPNCGAIKVELVQFNIQTQAYETIHPKRKKVAKFLKMFEKASFEEEKIEYGTKERSGFVYGINKELKNGSIHQYSTDFNGKKELIKVIKT
jgi:hypothetical protein